jgi:hypothetical protein
MPQTHVHSTPFVGLIILDAGDADHSEMINMTVNCATPDAASEWIDRKFAQYGTRIVATDVYRED